VSAVAGADLPLPAPFGHRGGQLVVDGLPLAALAERHGTPLYVTSERRLRANARRFLAAFRARWPDYRLLYALKANPNPALVRVLATEGLGADCSSPAEIRIAHEAGIAPERMLYTAAYPSDRELDFALRAGVPINLDDPALLPRLLALGSPSCLSFRINPGPGASGPEGLHFAGRGAKFGVSLTRAIAGYRAARRAGIERFGLHTMPGSNVLAPEHFARVGRFLGHAARRVAREASVSLDFLDAGGGFGVPYRPDERALDLPRVAAGLTDALAAALGPKFGTRPALCHEPGRYLLADTTVLLTRVTHVKRASPLLVGVDAGMQTLLRPALYGAYHPVHPVRPRTGPRRTVNVVGPVCENTDVLAARRRLVEPEIGDLYAIGNAGAYGFSMASQYNTRPRPAEVLVDRGRAQTIRRAEDFGDLVARVTRPKPWARVKPGAG
jgi:diaminopimelate decarboxylase